MLSDTDRTYLESLASRITEAEEAVARLIADRDDAIRLALEAEGKPTELGRIFGLSRERVYQIKDRRR